MANPFDKIAFWDSAIEADTVFLSNINSCLILAPHPDDESLGCAGLIALLRQQGCRITIVVTTDGSQSHPNSKQYPEAARIALRKAETKCALSLLQIPDDHIHFLNGIDTALPGKHDEGFSQFSSRLIDIIDTVNPQLYVVPYELDPHRDHRATWQILNAALKEVEHNGITVWEYPIWLYQNAVVDDLPKLQTGELLFIDITAALEIKRQAIASHRSQVSNLISDDPDGFMLSQEMINNFLTGKEYFMERKSLRKEHTLPADYFRRLYDQNRDPWNFEASEYEQEKYQATITYLSQPVYKNALEIGCSIGVLTALLCTKCDQLLSIDISETALDIAKERLKNHPHVHFRLAAIPDSYPDGKYDLVVLSEVGYYLSMEDLLATKQKIYESLLPDGTLIMVHWIHYVIDYPLTGDQVHQVFINDGAFSPISFKRTNDYRLNVFSKSANAI
ncbi:PIG-L family deacetylase [Mucilaginibacter sp. JRF]|uniref:bifunctional PIG-L family deacetylase/class I SAM-dependent methyltransferase n=1 Tax=Mucilaginibacter sp. JRF TaxID=2780088 RepID=UPI00187F6BB0|nr:bifunctional PIG-L family deacetylase/class I SAM-dependent methyltransferase [Mucilaginibacter sp. JRF]MBE9584233.1 PIG-L family deacetylase [Mucilaginibacter sp. JRF]